MCGAPELPKLKKRNGNFIVFNIGIKRSFFSSKMRPREAKPNRAGAFSEMRKNLEKLGKMLGILA